MNERILQFRVGVTILAAIMITVILLLVFMGTSPGLNGTYTIYVRFTDAPGVGRNTPVRKSGIRIGRVSDLKFTDDDTAVLVTLEIDRERRLYDDEYCQAVSSLLIGDAAIDFVRGPAAAVRNPVVAGQTLQGRLAQDPTRALASLQQELTQTLGTVDTAGRDIHNVLGRVDRLMELNEQRITQVIGDADETLQLMKTALKNSNDLLGDPEIRSQIKLAVSEMPVIMREARTTVEKAGITMDKAGATIDKVSETVIALDDNPKNLEGLTKPLGEKGGELIERLDDGAAKFADLMTELDSFTKNLNDPHGSVARLVHDPELYDHVNHIARNVEDLTRQLQPILDDARTFSDKIARDPGVLGVRGALQKSNHLKGQPAPYDRPSTTGEQYFTGGMDQ